MNAFFKLLHEIKTTFFCCQKVYLKSKSKAQALISPLIDYLINWLISFRYSKVKNVGRQTDQEIHVETVVGKAQEVSATVSNLDVAVLAFYGPVQLLSEFIFKSCYFTV